MKVKIMKAILAAFLIPLLFMASIGSGKLSAFAIGYGSYKTARVLPNGAIDIGSRDNPVPVNIGDVIEYNINLTVPSAAVGKYDLLFVLDWSSSMKSPYVSGPVPALNLAKESIFELCRRTFDSYPDSRIAVMGLNCKVNNTNDPKYLVKQYNTDFVDSSGYETVIKKAFSTGPLYSEDDNSQFLAAAIDKMKSRFDKSRTPVIIVISDFMMDQDPKGTFYTPVPNYWSTCMKQRANEYYNAFANGYLLMVRVHHKSNHKYCTPDFDRYMLDYVIQGRKNSHFIKFDSSQSDNDRTELLWKTLDDAMPSVYAITQDNLAPGLEFIDSEPLASQVYKNGDVTTLIWTISHITVSQYNIKIRAQVKENGIFENYATTFFNKDNAPYKTNSTWHMASGGVKKLHLRQEILERGRSSVELPNSAYLLLKNYNTFYPVTAVSGARGAFMTPFTEYNITISPSDYTLYIEQLLPQYYENAGYCVTQRGTDHDPAARQTGTPALNYSVVSEYWVTLYLRPVAGGPKEYEWNNERNYFGKIYNSSHALHTSTHSL
ncbi:MAG: hypothetical protein LBQ95_02750 [Lachnospiraceae bacterium]|jgi:hypothetical protein|nr:hypothetical protein [Lachnospiraceae bacterium]